MNGVVLLVVLIVRMTGLVNRGKPAVLQKLTAGY
jgi:hypothetical protein